MKWMASSLAVATAVGGCLLVGNDFEGYTLAGGVAAGGVGGSGGTSTTDGGGGASCVASECPDPGDCVMPVCVEGECVTENEAAGTGCTVGGKLCDGDGECVDCLQPGDCTDEQKPVCKDHTCVKAECDDGLMNGDETDLDCGGSCTPCANDLECAVNGDCQSGFCEDQGGVGGAGGAGGGAAAKHCKPCSASTQCDTDKWCDPSVDGGTCVGDLVQGQACTADEHCPNDACEDGFCCDAPCNGGCDVCAKAKGASSDGTCTVAAAASPGEPACAPYLCDGISGGCPSACAGDGGCAGGYYCATNDGNKCLAKKAGGEACSGGNECANGHCVDGFCCDSPCGGACKACSKAKTGLASGVCANVTGNTDPDGECKSGACDGMGACKLADGQPCSKGGDCLSSQCADGVCCNYSCSAACDACSVAAGAQTDGTCATVAPGALGKPSCAPYVCDGNGKTCPTTCAADADCASGAYCVSNKCVVMQSCQELLKAGRTSGGTYEIDPDGVGGDAAFKVYCIQSSAEGGGWTLAMKIDGTKPTFTYASPEWASSTPYNPGNPGYNTVEAKLASFATVPFTELRLGMRSLITNQTKWIVVAQQSTSLLNIFKSGTKLLTNLGRDKWKSLIDGSSLQQYCNVEGFNLDYNPLSARVRIGIIGNEWNDCNAPDSRLGFGMDGAGCNGDATNVCGNEAHCGGDNGDQSIKMFGYVFLR